MEKEIWRENLHFLRKARKENQSKIASVLNKTQQAIGNWEKGIGQPNITELNKITNYFGISISDFLNTDLSKGKLTEKRRSKKNQKKVEVNGKITGKLIEESDKKEKPPGTSEEKEVLIHQLLLSNQKTIATQEALISSLNAQLSALTDDIERLKKEVRSYRKIVDNPKISPDQNRPSNAPPEERTGTD